MSAPNPFRPAEQVAPKVMCLIYGPAGVGKTYLALTSPGRIAVIDTEGGTAHYANRVGHGLHAFDVLPTKTFAQVEGAIAFLKANPGTYRTLVIDPVTVLYETLQDAAQDRRAEIKRNADADLEMLDWQRIKRVYKRLMTDLANLPVNVVVTAREADLTEEFVTDRGRKERRKIGVRPDAEKGTPYYFDTVVRLVPAAKGREAIVEKDRTGMHALNAKVAAPTFDKLFGGVLAGTGTADRGVQSDEEAARIDANSTMVAAEIEDRDEILTSLGEITRVGAVARGSGLRSDLDFRQMPNGWMVGFRLEVGDGKAVPQVVARDDIGTMLHAAVDGEAHQLYGLRVEVTGELFQVEVAGRRPFHRLMATRIIGPEWTIPAPAEVVPPQVPAGDVEEASSSAEAPVEAESLPLFAARETREAEALAAGA